MHHRTIPSARRGRQRGATLLVALIMLVLIMMIGLVAVTSSSTQFKLAGNLQFEDVAMNRAETAIATAEKWLSTGTNYQSTGFTTYDSVNTAWLHPLASAADRVAATKDPITMTWDGTYDKSVASGERYMIELMSTNNRLIGSSAGVGGQKTAACNQVNTYMITGRGASARGAVKLVQSYFSVLAC